MRKKIRLIPFIWSDTTIEVFVRDNRNIIVAYLDHKDFELIDILGNIIKPFTCTEYPIGYYRLIFKECILDKIRIKAYGFTTNFKKLKR